jgi:hypothetical protein
MVQNSATDSSKLVGVHSKKYVGCIESKRWCNTIKGKKVKLSLCLTEEELCHEGVWGSGCIDPYFS